jgi:hypothetical protein
MLDFLELFIAHSSVYRVPTNEFLSRNREKRILLLSEIKWSFRGIQCYAEWPILCYKTERNKRNKNTQKYNIFTE